MKLLALGGVLFTYSCSGGISADRYLRELVENSTGYVTGHLQVQHPRLRTEMDPANSLADAGALLEAVRRLPEVATAAPRVQTLALASSAGQSQNFMLTGVEPKAEREVSFMYRAVRSGRPLDAGADRDIVLGDRLAEKLGLRLGDKLVVMVQSLDGSVGSAAYRVSGLFDTGSDAFDARLGFITLAAAQSLLGSVQPSCRALRSSSQAGTSPTAEGRVNLLERPRLWGGEGARRRT